MATVEVQDGQCNDREEGVSAGSAGGPEGGGLVLPEEVVAGLAAQLVARARAGDPVRLTGRGGLLSGGDRAGAAGGPGAGADQHLRQDGGAGGNGRNGYSAKTLRTEAGPVTLAVPRDRAGSFEPVLVPKHDRRTSGISDQVVSLYASGMSVRDIARHLERSAGIEVSPDTVSRITDGCLEEMRAWQSRPLEQVYPVVFVDALVAKVRDGGSVRNKAVNIAGGVHGEGIKHVLGIWVSAAEGAKTWAQALAQMRNRGLEDVIFCCCDGLGGRARRSPRPGRPRPCRPAWWITPTSGYADLVAWAAGGGRAGGVKVGIIRGLRGRRGAGLGVCSGRAWWPVASCWPVLFL